MIAIIDYGAGNLRSVAKAFESLGYASHITTSHQDLEKSAAIVLPGVGAFGDGMANLERLGLIEVLNQQVLVQKKPYLGICLGMQFLAEESLEHGSHRGLGWIPGVVQKIVPMDAAYRIPHIGWNNISFQDGSPLFLNLEAEPVFYFVHSYHMVLQENNCHYITSTCWHGTTITASVQKENIFGVQFHPEKSQRTGMTLLSNFAKIVYGEHRDAQKTPHTSPDFARWDGSSKCKV
ncbi:imidazole glycerol phosphate synthase subunit HisH [Desulfobacca acetoxidans]